ncbi:MAG: ThuA domain-containing protein [Verrucomicrobiales bacterium]|nr:ThuA domain-containing protein [Verrucomicrobiales bacterium]
MHLRATLACLAVLVSPWCPAARAAENPAPTKIVLIAGSVSHGAGEHEFKAGCSLLASKLNTLPGLRADVHFNGWPTEASAFDGASAVFIYCDGGDGHPAIRPERLKILADLMAKGVGLGTCHYGVEVPKGDPGDAWLRWTGGYFETFWSVNPHWDADILKLPEHPITRGVKPFKIRDEWYYHMRFPEGMKGVTPLLSALPPKETLERPNGPHSGNPHVRAAVERGEAQHLMWCTERPDGGRGFGFTGGHFHRNWAQDDFRKVVLNGLLWIAKREVPAGGVVSTVSADELKLNLDAKPAR